MLENGGAISFGEEGERYEGRSGDDETDPESPAPAHDGDEAGYDRGEHGTTRSCLKNYNQHTVAW